MNSVSSVVKIGLGVATDPQNSHNRDGQRSRRIPFSHSAIICVICAICGQNSLGSGLGGGEEFDQGGVLAGAGLEIEGAEETGFLVLLGGRILEDLHKKPGSGDGA